MTGPETVAYAFPEQVFNSIENQDFQAPIRNAPARQWADKEILSHAFANVAYHTAGGGV